MSVISVTVADHSALHGPDCGDQDFFPLHVHVVAHIFGLAEQHLTRSILHILASEIP